MDLVGVPNLVNLLRNRVSLNNTKMEVRYYYDILLAETSFFIFLEQIELFPFLFEQQK
jgi:hypothetical protein